MTRRTLNQRIGYNFVHAAVRLASIVFFHLRCHDRHWEPKCGGAIICSNHQSYLDPVFVGAAFQRRLNFLARKSLFRWGPFGWLIASMDAIPIDRDGLGLAGLREALRRLKRGEMVLIFPEGTRSRDGELGPFLPGLAAIARRSRVSLAPVGLDGAYQAWPRSRLWPRSEPVHLAMGEPITAEQAASMSDCELLAELERRVRLCQERARRQRLRRPHAGWVRLP